MTAHPLDMVTADEITRAVAIARDHGRLADDARFAHVVLQEPGKEYLRGWKAGDPVDRELRLLIVPGHELRMVEAVVSVTAGEVRRWDEIEGMRPALMFVEALNAIVTTKEHPEYVAALARRGVTDLDRVQIDPWPAGSFGYDAETDRRIARCISFLRETPDDNGYARPIEGVIVHFDLGRNEVIEVIDHGVVPLPQQHARYTPDEHEPLRRDLKPLEIMQPEGPSFTVDGNLVRWGRWSLRIAFDPHEGLVLHQVAYDDHGRERTILHRASVSEMVVPYGDPGPLHGWKNAFDAGEWGLGRMTQPLKLGCDCLGVIHYVDGVLASESGDPYVIENAICIHEEDYGILWKHVDLFSGHGEVRRSRRLVLNSIATVGNYEYGFSWYLYLDGNIQLEVKLTGIVSPMAIDPGTTPEFANVVAQRKVDAATSRSWKIVNPHVTNGLGQPVAYRLVPTMTTPTMLAQPDSSVGKRAGFAQQNLWVTPYAPDERRAAGEHPNQHEGGDGLPRWTAQDRNLVDTDVVLWYTFGVTHFVRPEDWPVMPVEYTGFLLTPNGFFDRNPALDLPPSYNANGHC